MNILAQVGFGKSTYIEDAVKDGSLSGAILSPRDEDAASLASTVQRLSDSQGVTFVAVDPQFYAFTVPDARLRKLDGYPYNPGILTRRSYSDADTLRKLSVTALQFQSTLSVTHLITPAIPLVDLRDSSSQIFITMAQESLKHVDDARPLLLSLILSESALLSPDQVDEFLDVITAWDYRGIYLCVQPNNSIYPATLSSPALANLLYLIYVLAELNNYTVVVGFTDFNSILFRAAGANYVASGWHNSLKQFSLARYAPKKKGGARARPRYSSRPLLAPILVEPELAEIVDAGLEEYALSGSVFDTRLLGDVAGTNWPTSIAYRAHVATLARLDEEFTSASTAKGRFASALQSVGRARSSFELLAKRGISFETRAAFLRSWQDAVEQTLERI